MEYLLEDELKDLGFSVSHVSAMGVYGEADLKTMYKICLWSRLANRVQWVLFSDKVSDIDSLTKCCRDYNWNGLFNVDQTLAIDFHGQSSFINNTMYGAQLVKDGIVDYFKAFGSRPSVDKKNPDIRLHAHIKHDILTVSFDLVGYSLHQRGYRQMAGSAPLKENIAAALLIRAKWTELYNKGYHLLDPFCGSGTLLIEAAMMAANIAPGLFREDQAFKVWQGHDDTLWQATIDEALKKRLPLEKRFIGFDQDENALKNAQENISKAGLTEAITLKKQAIKDFQSVPGPGLFICNPPYGERLKNASALRPLYEDMGKALFNHCQNWQAAILTSNPELVRAIGLRIDKQYHFYNGPLDVKLYCFEVDETNQLKTNPAGNLNPHMTALQNRLRKNKKHLAKWLKRNGHSCYRLYDADLPNYAFAVDIYGDWAHVQEYAPPKDIPQHKAKKRIQEMLQILPEIIDIPADHIVLKQRKQQKGSAQYQAFANKNQFFNVREGSAILKVNLHDYLDTGLFLDHRPLRLALGKNLSGKRFLNCFSYTAAFSIHAALAGALTCNVDLSNTYDSWAKDNFKLNKINPHKHRFIQADCLEWLKHCQEKFDVILLDPPSFSNSKRMKTTLDIQRDQDKLVDLAMKCLTPEGVLYFSNNLNSFKLSEHITKTYNTEDITAQTLDEDFKRAKKSHRCYKIQF